MKLTHVLSNCNGINSLFRFLMNTDLSKCESGHFEPNRIFNATGKGGGGKDMPTRDKIILTGYTIYQKTL